MSKPLTYTWIVDLLREPPGPQASKIYGPLAHRRMFKTWLGTRGRRSAHIAGNPLVSEVAAYCRTYDSESRHGDGLCFDLGYEWEEWARGRLSVSWLEDGTEEKLADFLSEQEPQMVDNIGVLGTERRGPTSIITVQVPEGMEAAVKDLIAKLNADRVAPTLDAACALAKQNDALLRETGIEHLYVHGSVARGTASPASDIDLYYVQSETKAGFFGEWSTLRQTFEIGLRCLCDVIAVRTDDVARLKGAVLIWSAGP